MRTALLLLALILTAGIATSQTIKKDTIKHHLTITADGKIKDTPTQKATKQADKVYQVIGGQTVYQGAKGGLYYYKTSSKTGKQYKAYIPKEK